MNFLKRALTSYLSHSHRPGRRCLTVLRPVAAQSAPYSSSVQRLDRNYEPSRKPLARTVKKQVEGITDWPRPSEIPYQAKVANSVNLVGHINAPVKIQSGPNGKALAGAVLSQDIAGKLVIPLVFEGDLANVVSLHVKASDTVHVVGRLSEDPHPFVLDRHQGSLHLVVEEIKFVQGFVNSSPVKKFPKKIISEPEEDDEFAIISMKRLEPEVAETKLYQTSLKSGGVAGSDQWEDLLKNPNQWLDYREKKVIGLVKEKHPDFKHKENKTPLWLNSAPKSVLQELGKVKDDAQEIDSVKDDAQKSPAGYSKQGGGKPQGNGKFVNRDESWKNFVEDPSKWWDNRTGKINAKSPDFKHKETGEALWMSSAPSWVKQRLPPPLKEKNDVAA